MTSILLDDLKALIARREAVCFVGEEVSVLSVSAEQRDLATWTGLLKSGVQRCVDLRLTLPPGWSERQLSAIESEDPDELLGLSEQVSAKLKAAAEGEFGRWLLESVGTLSVTDRSILNAIRDLGLTIVTTNYDGLLEEVTGLAAVTWKDPAAIERILRGADRGIIHLHGHYRQPESIVLGIRSRENFLTNEHAQAVLRAIRTMKSLLFIGFGKELTYPNFAALLAWSREVFSESHYRHFRLVLNGDVEALQKEHPGMERVFALGFGDSREDLPGFLRSLAPWPRVRVLGSSADPRQGSAPEIVPPVARVLPPMPDLVIGRGEELDMLKKCLSEPRRDAGTLESGIQTVTAVRGWPGVGKTTLAAALAHDPEIAAAFPGGVLWASLGPKPNFFSELAAWGRELGEPDLLRVPTLKDAVHKVQRHLADRRALLVVDDVYAPEHALPFLQVRGRASQLLITTREMETARSLTSDPGGIHVVPELSASHSVELLEVLAPQAVREHPEKTRALAEALGCLPLALRVAGQLLAAEAHLGWGVADLLEELRCGERILKATVPSGMVPAGGLEIPTVEMLFQRSSDRLDPDTRRYFALLGCILPKPATTSLAALSELWKVDDPRPAVRTLVDRGLLEPAGANRFQIHSLLARHARSLLAGQPEGGRAKG